MSEGSLMSNRFLFLYVYVCVHVRMDFMSVHLSITYYVYVSIIMYLSSVFLVTYQLFLGIALDFLNPCCSKLH